MTIFRVSYFDISHQRVIPDISVFSKNIDDAKKHITKAIPKNTNIIMLLEEGRSNDAILWHWVGRDEWYDSEARSDDDA
ncbi:MAG: hypothetical protein LBG29_04545 [Synergistaceae bacterium]|jgi:hypothetical protein|nr:hypothetical protein [Synergistaceae bacterium]